MILSRNMIKLELLIIKNAKMELQIKIHVGNELEASKEVVERIVNENIENKMDSYLKKFDKADAECIIEVKADKNKKGTFNGTLAANLDRETYHYEREDYENLDHLINNLFKHLKEDLSSK